MSHHLCRFAFVVVNAISICALLASCSSDVGDSSLGDADLSDTGAGQGDEGDADGGEGGTDADAESEDADAGGADADAGDADGGAEPPDDKWVSAYLSSWNHYIDPDEQEGANWGNLETDQIDWDAFTHLNYFALAVRDDGTTQPIQNDYENMNQVRVEAIVEAAHDHDKPILISVGGWGNHEGFVGSISDDHRSDFVDHLVDVMNEWDFDGIDMDMEPINDEDVDDYVAFVEELHGDLQSESTPLFDRPLLTTATAWQSEMHADLADYFDQINLMTYDFSGAYEGWVTWHNSNLYNGGHVFESTGRELPSIERDVDEFLDAGVPGEKLGIGIDFYGYVWTGVSQPRESWDDNNPPEVEDNVPYHEIYADYYDESYEQWDDDASAPYLSIDDEDPPQFVSYDNERAIGDKLDYVEEEGLGGSIIWELGGGFLEGEPEGERDPLLQAVKEGRGE